MPKITELPVAAPTTGEEETIVIQGGEVKRGPFPRQQTGLNLAGSLLFLNGNGESQQSSANGLLYLPTPDEMFKQATAGDSRFFGAGSNDAWVCIIAIPVEQYRYMNRLPVIWNNANVGTMTGGNDWGVTYYPPAHPNGAIANTFLTRVSQAGGGVSCRTAQLPANFSGLGLLQLRESGGTLFLEFTDFVTGDKTVGSAALPGGFLGKQSTGTLAIGGAGNAQIANFPTNIDTAWGGTQNCGQCSDIMMRDFAFIERNLTDAEILQLRDGTPFASIVAEADRRLYAPLVTNGEIDLAISGNKPGLAAKLVQLGNVGAGSSLTGQTAAKHLRLARQANPCLVAHEFGQSSARFNIRIASQAGLTGTRKEGRVTSNGRILKDWHLLDDYTDAAGDWVVVMLPDHDEEMQVSVRSVRDPEIVATITRVFACWHWAVWGQSEAVYSTIHLANTAAVATANFDQGPERFFVQRNNGAGARAIVDARLTPARYGEALCAFGEHARRYTRKPIVVSVCAVSGTGKGSWVNDSDPRRNGQFDIDLCGMIANRNAQGQIPVTVNIESMWEAADIGLGPNFDLTVYPAWLYGQQVNAWTINRYLYDGNLALSAAWAVVPSARFGNGGAKNFDDQSMADVRESMRRAAAIFGGHLGPDPTPMYWENNGLAGHHPRGNHPNGDHFTARCIAEAGLRAHGLGTYRGPSRFAHYEWVSGSGNTAVILTLDTQFPGEITPNVAGAAITGFEARLTTAGGRSRLNVASATILNGRQIRVDLTGAANPAEFGIWFHSGGPGDYGNAAVNTAWVEGAPLFNGWPITGGNSAIPLKP